MALTPFAIQPPAMAHARAFIARAGFNPDDFEHEEDILVFERQDGFRITLGMTNATQALVTFSQERTIIELTVDAEGQKAWQIHASTKRDYQVACLLVERYLLPLL